MQCCKMEHMELIWCCWCFLIPAEATWGLELEEVPPCHASPLAFLVLGSSGSSCTLQHICREPGWVWCFPQGHMPLDLSVHCSNIQVALCRADLMLSDLTNLDAAWDCLCSNRPPPKQCLLLVWLYMRSAQVNLYLYLNLVQLLVSILFLC